MSDYDSRCPFCASREIESEDDPAFDTGIAHQDLRCLECGAVYRVNYEVVGFTRIGDDSEEGVSLTPKEDEDEPAE